MPVVTETEADPLLTLKPNRLVSIREAFGVDSEMLVPAFTERDSHEPDLDEA